MARSATLLRGQHTALATLSTKLETWLHVPIYLQDAGDIIRLVKPK